MISIGELAMPTTFGEWVFAAWVLIANIAIWAWNHAFEIGVIVLLVLILDRLVKIAD